MRLEKVSKNRSVLIALAECSEMGISRWLGATLSSHLVENKEELMRTAERGLGELQALLARLNVR